MKPRVFFSGLTGTIYVSTRYSERPGGLFVSHVKYDVTQDAIIAVREHVNQCHRSECVCRTMFAPLGAVGAPDT